MDDGVPGAFGVEVARELFGGFCAGQVGDQGILCAGTGGCSILGALAVAGVEVNFVAALDEGVGRAGAQTV